MPLINLPARARTSLPFFCSCLVLVLPLFGHLDALPIRLWDESRQAVSALEMIRNGNWLIPHCMGAPDMWSTKPPLMIWLQALSIRMLGPTELAVRLPAALAAAATCLLLYWYFARRLQKPWWGFVAVAALVSCNGYVTLHGTRTGDFDALLTLCTTGTWVFLLSFLRTGRTREWYVAMWFMACGVLTKGVAALLPVPGLLLLATLEKKWHPLLRSRHTWPGIAVALLPAAGYYLVREQLNSGYLATVWNNELGGRYSAVIENHKAGFFYYFELLGKQEAHALLFLVICGALWAVSGKKDPLRDTALAALVTALCHLLILSGAATKLEWYHLPDYPLLAVLAASGLYFLFHLLRAFRGWQGLLRFNILPWLAPLLLLPAYAQVLDNSFNTRIPMWELDNNHMAEYLRSVVQGKRTPVMKTLLWEDYALNLDWYLGQIQDKGINMKRVVRHDLQPGMTVAVYQPDMHRYVANTFVVDTVENYRNVVVYRLDARR